MFNNAMVDAGLRRMTSEVWAAQKPRTFHKLFAAHHTYLRINVLKQLRHVLLSVDGWPMVLATNYMRPETLNMSLAHMADAFVNGLKHCRDRFITIATAAWQESFNKDSLNIPLSFELSGQRALLSVDSGNSELSDTDAMINLGTWRAQQREVLLRDKQEAERLAAEEEAERARAAAEKRRLKAEAEVWAAQEAQRLRAEEDERQRQAAEEEQRRQAEEAERQRAIAEEERRCQREEAERSRKLVAEKAEQERRRKAEEEERQRRVTEEQAEQERRRLRAERVKVYSPDMTGQEFERYLAYQLSRRGLVPRVTGGTGDRGADIVLDTPLRRAVIQAKHHNKRVGNKAVQEVHTARSIYERRAGYKFDAWVISPSGFSPQAESDARELGVILVDDPESFFDSLIPPSPNPPARTAAGPQTESTRGSASPA